ncbi:MAG: DUF5688 family protein [Lachnospiraceae bacterium]|nr:DUF5688 family protein [Lachnospiraceae bacterium]
MNYSEFKMYLLTELSNYAGCDVQVTIHSVRKNNGIILDGLTMHRTERNVAPTIYLEKYWERYQEGVSGEEIVRQIISENEKYSIDRNLNVEEFLDFDRIRPRVMYKLINFKMNRDFLDTVPMRKVMDLAVIYIYEVEDECLLRATCTVRNEDIERWGVTEEELWELASVNTPRNEPAKIKGISETLRDFYTVDGREGEQCFEDLDEMIGLAGMTPMHILTNKSQVFGASCILYPDMMKTLAREFKSDLYVLPSSIHEVILMPVDDAFNPDDLSAMVREINEHEVLPQEVLSDHVYRYCADREVITM